MSGGFMVFVFTQILFLLNFRKSYIFGVNEVSEVIASLEVNDNRNERWRRGENKRMNYRR